MSEGKELGPVLVDKALPGLPERFQPRNLTELMSWSKLVVSSGLAPKGMNESAVVIAVQMGAELRITPTQALQNIAVINNRPSIWGDLGLALFKRDAAYEAIEERPPDEAEVKGEGFCRIRLKDGSTIERRFSREHAKKAKLYERSGATGPWNTYEGRMLQMRARWWAMRDAAPEVFKGCSSREEQEDVIHDVTAEVTIRRPEANDVPITPDSIDRFVKDQRPATVGSGPASAQVDRSKLQKVLVHDVAERTKGTTTWYEIQVETAGGQKLSPTTFDTAQRDLAKSLKGGYALITTKQKGNFLNLAHIEADGPQEAPSAQDDEPGSAG